MIQQLGKWGRQAAALFRRRRMDAELEEEMRLHLEMKTAALSDRDSTKDEAMDRARRQFGNALQLRERSRESWGWVQLERLGQDIRYGARMLRRSPGVTVVAILTLAIGIGAHTAVCSLAYSLFYQRLAVQDPDAIASVSFYSRSGARDGFSYPAYTTIRDHSSSFQYMAAHYSTSPLHIVVNGSVEETNGAVVSANYFPMMGITPGIGRFFSVEEDATPDRTPVAVLSYDYWQSHYAGASDAIGQKIRINGVLFDIIGVAPQNFRGVMPPLSDDIWIPTAMLRTGYRWCDALKPGCSPLNILGRLAKDRTIAQAQTELAPLAANLAAEYKVPAEEAQLLVEPGTGASRRMMSAHAPSIRLLFAASGLLLIVVAANVAGLLVVRAEARRKEIAIRIAIGAGRGRLVRQWITESLMLALLGGGGGLAVWIFVKNLLLRLYATGSETNTPMIFTMPLSPLLIGYTFGVAVFLGVIFGVLPALEAARKDPAIDLKDGGSRDGARRTGLRSTLVAAQIALTLPLVIGAGLLTRSTETLLHASAFDPARVALLRLRPRLVNYTATQAQAFVRGVQQRLLNVPGVESVSFAEGVGPVWELGSDVEVGLPGQNSISVDHHEVAPAYFQTLGLPFLAGRDFDARDVAGMQRVAIVNDTLAARLWPGQSPIGRLVLVENKNYMVVGEVKNVLMHNAMDAPPTAVYVPFWQNSIQPQVDARMCIRVRTDARSMLPVIRQAVTSADANVPVTEMTSLADQIGERYFQVFLAANAIPFAGALALLLSALGLYAVLSFVVAGRTREIGIRLALGAQTRDVMRMVLGQGARLALCGVVVGGVGAIGLTGLLGAWLYGVPARDPAIFLAAATALLAVALAACYVPARRAARVDPLIALRDE